LACIIESGFAADPQCWAGVSEVTDHGTVTVGKGGASMMKQTAHIVCLVACFAGCGTDPVNVDADDSGRTIMLEVDQELVVELASNPSTGYSWSFQLTREGVIAANGSEYEPTEPQLPGSGGRERFRFIAMESGRTALQFDYRRSWETETPPAETVTYDVVVQ
jgi:inhibitor of cysteine peptidase